MRHMEDGEQRALCHYLEAKRAAYFAVPNGGARSKIEAAIMKGLGVKRGVPDIIVCTRTPKMIEAGKVAIAIEMKARTGGKASPEQKAWIEVLRGQGWIADVCKGFDEAHRLLIEWGI